MDLADTSAWTNRSKQPLLRAQFDAAVAEDLIATCDVVEAELLWTARSPHEFESMCEEFAGFTRIRVESIDWDRSLDVWHQLVQRGRHRQVKHADLLIAAVAERAGVGVLHYDRDYELIAEVTGQPQRALAPLGSL